MTFRRYVHYREVEGLGEVPCHWNAPHMKRIARLTYGDALALDVRNPNGEVAVYGSNGPVGVHGHANTLAPAILVGRKGSCGALNWSPERVFAIDTVYFIDRNGTSEHLRWLFWALHTLGLSDLSQDTGVPGLPREVAHELRLPVPPKTEQAAIAAFLDHETGKIDALVEAQRRLIDLLKEKRQAVITRAVTKGLDPTVPMADSGIYWLGNVPEHWHVKRLRFLCDISTGDGDTVDAEPDGEFPFYVRSPAIERIGRFTHDCEAVLTSGDGAGVGKIFHYVAGRFTAHQRVYIFNNFRDVSGKFFFHYLRENFFKVALEGGAKSTVDSLRRPLIANFWMTVPPPQEQEAIVEEVERISDRFNALMDEAASAITLLQERRAALIFAAVMGTIDVQCHLGVSPVVVNQVTARRLVGAAVLELVADTRASSRMTSAKRMYLAEAHAGVSELRGQPQRMAAGPFDGALMSEVEAELARVGHIAASQPGGPNSKVHYRLTGHRGALRAELDALLGDRRAAFDKMLADLGKLESKGVEAVATLYAVWNDMLIDGMTPTDDAVIDGVLNDWHAEKRDKFNRADLHNYLGWMRRHGMTPTGRGPRTKSGALL